MHADIHHALRTVCGRVVKEDRYAWRIEHAGAAKARVTGVRGRYVATVVVDGRAHVSPVYPRHEDAVDAALAPLVASVRGEEWRFPAPADDARGG